VQASLDLRAARMIGIHWGTFALAREPYDEPPSRLAAEAARRDIDPHDVWVLKPGETRDWGSYTGPWRYFTAPACPRTEASLIRALSAWHRPCLVPSCPARLGQNCGLLAPALH